MDSVFNLDKLAAMANRFDRERMLYKVKALLNFVILNAERCDVEITESSEDYVSQRNHYVLEFSVDRAALRALFASRTDFGYVPDAASGDTNYEEDDELELKSLARQKKEGQK